MPRYCSVACKARSTRDDRRREYEREYRRANRGRRIAYERAYNRRPEVRERNAERMRLKWHNDPEFRAASLKSSNLRRRWRWRNDPEYRAKVMDRYRRRYDALNPFRHVVIPAPYTGHRWLEMAKNVVSPHLDLSSPWADQYHDDMGEALLAIMEGRDPKEAVREYRRREYVPRHLTRHISDYKNEDGDEAKWFDQTMPTVESAEDEAIAHETVQFLVKARTSGFGGSSAKPSSRHAGHKTQQPSRRRMKDKSLRSHRRGWTREMG